MFIDNKLAIRVRITQKPTTFGRLLGGRCFILSDSLSKDRQTIFIKLNKRWSQAIDDNNYRTEFQADREVNEVVLVYNFEKNGMPTISAVK